LWLVFSVLHFHYFFIVLYFEWSNYNLSGGVTFLVLTIWYSVSFLHLDDPLILRLEKFSVIILFHSLSITLVLLWLWFIFLVFSWYPRWLVCCMYFSLGFFHFLLLLIEFLCFFFLSWYCIFNVLHSLHKAFNWDFDLQYWVILFTLIVFQDLCILIDILFHIFHGLLNLIYLCVCILSELI
jgi:hypothetical protein